MEKTRYCSDYLRKKNCNKQNPYRNKHRGDKDENWKSVKLEIMLNFIS